MGKVFLADDDCFYSLRSWILRRMKKMRIAMRTMAMPAPITIPTIWGENKHKGGGSSYSTHFHSCITGYTCYRNQTSMATMHFLQRGPNIDTRRSHASWLQRTMLVWSSPSTNVLKLFNPSWNREKERNRGIVYLSYINTSHEPTKSGPVEHTVSILSHSALFLIFQLVPFTSDSEH